LKVQRCFIVNIVLVSMDCVRPDYLTYSFFDRLKKEGEEYTNCIAQAPHTSTSHVSILTGLYPFSHKVRWLLDFNVKGQMIQEVLKENGYETAAFIGGFPLTTGNLNRGFDIFEHREVVNDTLEGRSFYDPANVLSMRAIEWLDKRKTSDNFVFLHFFDAHLTLRSELVHQRPEKDEKGIYRNIGRYLGRRERRYREEIRFMSEQLQLLLDLCDPDLLVITSDHGEKMQGEKNYPWVYNSKGKQISSHFHEVELWDIQLRVPLLFYGSGIQNKLVAEQVRSIDIMPTILDLVDIKPPKTDGISLIEEKYPKYAYSETFFSQLMEKNVHSFEMDKEHSWGWRDIDPLVSLRTNRYKLICSAKGKIKPLMLFDLAKDVEEEKNMLDKNRVQKRLEHELVELLRNDDQWI